MNGLTVGGLFDGIGLLAYGLCRAGLEHRWLCEIDPFRRQVLARRWPGVRIFDDVRAVGASAERVDVIAGGFPCKGASSAGKRNGFDHPETVLWREMARAVRELRPRYVLVENVADILSLHDGAVWGEVIGDLAASGYGVEWDCFPAAAFGAPHRRDRVIAVATDAGGGGQGPSERHLRPRELHAKGGTEVAAAIADADGAGRPAGWEPQRSESQRLRDIADEDLAGTPADADRSGRQDPALAGRLPSERSGARNGRGVRVDWGRYEAAIGRWESIVGPAPEPLVRRVDDRRAMRVERSRLSALGDGVQVQLGELVGRYLMELNARKAAA